MPTLPAPSPYRAPSRWSQRIAPRAHAGEHAKSAANDGDGPYSRAELLGMNRRFVERIECAFAAGGREAFTPQPAPVFLSKIAYEKFRTFSKARPPPRSALGTLRKFPDVLPGSSKLKNLAAECR